MIVPLELINANSSTHLCDDEETEKKKKKSNSLKTYKETLIDIVSSLFFIIGLLILLNLMVIAVWIYGLVSALSVRN